MDLSTHIEMDSSGGLRVRVGITHDIVVMIVIKLTKINETERVEVSNERQR